MSTSSFIDPQDLQELAGTKLRARAVVEGLLAGMHRDPNRGSSVEFSEYKEYVPGDELKHIDWRAYARVDRYYVKQFEDETHLQGYFLLDQSGSMDFSFGDALTKFEYGATLAATMSWLMLRQGDAPGLLLFDEEARSFLKPSTRKTQLDDLCSVLDSAAVSGTTNVSGALSRAAEMLRGRSLVVLISDFIDVGEEALTFARILRRRGMEVVCFHLMDRAEWTLPWEQMCRFEGMEGDGEELVEPDEIRGAYQREVQKHIDEIEQTCERGDIEYFHVFTDESPVDAIQALIRLRERRRR